MVAPVATTSGAVATRRMARVQALVEAVSALPAKQRTVVISGAGDRRDEDIREQTRIIGEAFDDVVLYQDACQRGRVDGEVLKLLRQGLDGAKRTTHIDEIHGEFLAIDRAMERLQKGDLCMFYHSNEGKEVVGIVKVVKTAYQDPTTDDSNWVVVDVAPFKALKQPAVFGDLGC